MEEINLISASEVAKWFLARNNVAMAEDGAENISNLKLQKLLYYAQGVYLAITGKPLFYDNIVAWKHGPVVVDVYHEYKEFGANGITLSDDFVDPHFNEETESILEDVYNEFGQFSAWKLREMTHNEDPWKETEQSKVIDKQLIKTYFETVYVA